MKLKTRPNDFRVDEILADGYLRQNGDHTVFHVTKKKLTSLQAAEVLARELGVEPADVSMAGLKDRQGVTTQYMSVPGKRSIKFNDPDLKFERIGYASEPYVSEHSLGNSFRIRLRDLDSRDLGRLHDNLESVRRDGAPNYFDDQRFGNLRHGQGWIAKDLMLGRVEDALFAFVAAPSTFDDARTGGFKAALRKNWRDWSECREIAIKFHQHQSLFAHLKREPEDFTGAFHRLSTRLRLIHLFAWQSHIWNRAVALYLAEMAGEGGAAVSNAIEGALVFPHRLSGDLLEIPLPGEKLDNIEDPAVRSLFERVLEHEGVPVDQFIIEGVPGFQIKGEPREMFVKPDELELEMPDDVDARRGRAVADLAFRLPRGAYATLVVRALLAQPVRGAIDPWRQGALSAYDGAPTRDDRQGRNYGAPGGRREGGFGGHGGHGGRQAGHSSGRSESRGGYGAGSKGGGRGRASGPWRGDAGSGGYRGRHDTAASSDSRGRDDRGGYRGRDDRQEQSGGYRGRDEGQEQRGGYRGRDERGAAPSGGYGGGQGGGYRGRDDRQERQGGYRERDERGGAPQERDDRGGRESGFGYQGGGQGGGYRGRDDARGGGRPSGGFGGGQGGGYRGRDDSRGGGRPSGGFGGGQGGGYRGRDDSRGGGRPSGGFGGGQGGGQGGGYRGRDDSRGGARPSGGFGGGQGGGYRGGDDSRARGGGRPSGGFGGGQGGGQGGGYRGRDDSRGGGRPSGGFRGGQGQGGARENRGWRHEEPGKFKRYVSEDDRRRARGEGPRLDSDRDRGRSDRDE